MSSGGCDEEVDGSRVQTVFESRRRTVERVIGFKT